MDIKIDTNAKFLSDDRIEINSKASRVMSKEEFKGFFQSMTNQLDNIKSQIQGITNRLKEISNIEETEELNKFKEMLKIAEKLKEKESLQENIQKLKEQEEKITEDMINMNKVLLNLK